MLRGATALVLCASGLNRELSRFPRKPGRDVDDVIAALRTAGVTEIELASVNTEAPSQIPACPLLPHRDRATADLRLRSHRLRSWRRGRALRDNLRKWRLSTPASHYAELKNRFHAAGMAVYAMSFQHDDDAFTDDEIGVTARSIGVEVIRHGNATDGDKPSSFPKVTR